MKRMPSLWLMVVMLMFPQIVETIYSPALGSLAHRFAVSDAQAAQTLSVYFLAFALGVVVWGIAADKWGRRPTMLLGLLIYSCAAGLAMYTDSFAVILLARAISAFGIAVGSVVTQTMLRDVFDGEALGKVFSLMGMGIAISPVLGMLLGGQLAQMGGYRWVFMALQMMALTLLLYNVFMLPETQTQRQTAAQPMGLWGLVLKMVSDRHIWQSAWLVALYNIALFSYYQLGPFVFTHLGLNAEQFGYSGVVLGGSTLAGSYINRMLLSKCVSQQVLLRLSAALLTVGALGVFVVGDTLLMGCIPVFLIPMVCVVAAFGIAIPNVLSQALVAYKQQAGSAGAILGLMYYVLIGVGLTLAGSVQALGSVLIVCAVITLGVTFLSCHVNRAEQAQSRIG
ncbi:multidrug effflux MFS transporter [Photobacterium japonica]|uniref:multidrug effflux MFS transporter n=1 Tax=Photobacterium japonica TaxID=2910235 RepID=UPI003D14F429